MGWCLLLASKHIRESSYSADEYAVALPCFGKVRTVFSCRLAFVPRKLAKSCERHDDPKIQIRSRIQSHLVRVRNLPLARYQCGLTGDALPCAVLIYPCVCESTVPLEGLSLPAHRVLDESCLVFSTSRTLAPSGETTGNCPASTAFDTVPISRVKA